MRTTVDLDEDVLKAARSLASSRGISLGKALSELARKGLQREAGTPTAGFPTFKVSPSDPVITPEHVKALLEEW